ncbi:Golgi to ER traffic protein 4 homolog [Augochlora pura]
MASVNDYGIARILARLQASINSNNFYEAHQVYRILYSRYLKEQNYSALLTLLYKGAINLLNHEQYASGADLGILFVNVLTKSKAERSPFYIKQVINLLSLMNPSSPERDTYIQSALQWSIINTKYKTGNPILHQKIAKVFWKEKNYVMAKQHFMRSSDARGCATMLVEYHVHRGYTNEVDLFIAQAVLQYLCLRNTATAQEVFNRYTLQHPNINSGPPYLLPLLNFLFFLLKTIDSGELNVFTILCQQYQISLNRDPCYRQYLDEIGQLFFKVPSPHPRQELFANLLSLLSGKIENSDSDSDTEDSNGAQRNVASTSYIAQELD